MKVNTLFLGMLASLSMGGCTVTSGEISTSAECSTGGSCRVVAEGKWKVQSLQRYLKPVAEILADSKYFTYEEFLAFDPKKFQIKIEGTSGSTIKNNQVNVELYDEYKSLITSKVFAVKLVDGKYSILEPESFKSWSSNYLDIIDGVTVSFEPTNLNGDGVSTTVSSILDNKVLAMTTYSSPKRPIP